MVEGTDSHTPPRHLAPPPALSHTASWHASCGWWAAAARTRCGSRSWRTPSSCPSGGGQGGHGAEGGTRGQRAAGPFPAPCTRQGLSEGVLWPCCAVPTPGPPRRCHRRRRRLPLEPEAAALGAALQAGAVHSGVAVADFVRQHEPQVSEKVRAPAPWPAGAGTASGGPAVPGRPAGARAPSLSVNTHWPSPWPPRGPAGHPPVIGRARRVRGGVPPPRQGRRCAVRAARCRRRCRRSGQGVMRGALACSLSQPSACPIAPFRAPLFTQRALLTCKP
jgi:hypothetical protein